MGQLISTHMIKKVIWVSATTLTTNGLIRMKVTVNKNKIMGNKKYGEIINTKYVVEM